MNLPYPLLNVLTNTTILEEGIDLVQNIENQRLLKSLSLELFMAAPKYGTALCKMLIESLVDTYLESFFFK